MKCAAPIELAITNGACLPLAVLTVRAPRGGFPGSTMYEASSPYDAGYALERSRLGGELLEIDLELRHGIGVHLWKRGRLGQGRREIIERLQSISSGLGEDHSGTTGK